MPADFRGLLDKYITHTITAAEREELFGLIASGQYDEQLGASIEGHLCDKVFEAVKFVIDGKGNIRFKLTGFSGGDDAAVEELSAMIDMAKKG